MNDGAHRSRSRHAAAAVGLAAVGLLATGCSVDLDRIAFRSDDRLHFTASDDGALLSEPVSLRWTMKDFAITRTGAPSRDSGYFAIFVDQAPVEPGLGLDAVAEDDPACQADPTCPDRQYLAARQIYTTTDMAFTLEQVAPLTGSAEDIQLHDVAIVLLDTNGRRIGESAWDLSFKLRKRPTL